MTQTTQTDQLAQINSWLSKQDPKHVLAGGLALGFYLGKKLSVGVKVGPRVG